MSRTGAPPCGCWRRPPGRCDQRFASAYLFAAVEPATGAGVALVLPEATTAAMNLFLAEFSRNLPDDVHAALVLDGAGWHGAEALAVPANVTLVPLPPGAAGLQGLPRPRRRLLRRLEPAHRRAGSPPLPLQSALDPKGQFMSSAV